MRLPLVGINGGGDAQINSVSCVDAIDCTAVGEDAESQALYLSETAGVWGKPTQITSASGLPQFFTSVSCTAVGDCTAVGSDIDAAGLCHRDQRRLGCPRRGQGRALKGQAVVLQRR